MENPALFPWLERAYQALLAADMEAQLPAKLSKATTLEKADARRLLGAASHLAYSSNVAERKQAYEIATRIVELFGDADHSILACADIVLSRIGNFPGRKLLENGFGYQESTRLPPRLQLERLGREFENTVEIVAGAEVALTDFQHRLLSTLGTHHSTSVSAPTSAGKSFVLGLDLVRRFQQSPQVVVYLVPTRALIREVSFSIRHNLASAGFANTPIRTVPFQVSEAHSSAGAVYVLTQERLLTLLAHADTSSFNIDALFVDEAHNIQDGARGVALQVAVERVAQRFPAAQINFASPLSKNPEMLLEMVGRNTDASTIVETLSPVSQNLVLVSGVQRKPQQAEFVMLADDGEVRLGIHELGFDFRGNPSQRKARFANAVTGHDEACIVFANDARDAEDIASELCEHTHTSLARLPSGIEELIEYVSAELHPRHPLITCLSSGIAFHYGDMPALVRTCIEDLFRDGELRFLCCTSTLLQGVNLPARHIVIENPKRGPSDPMPRRDFLNLAGRAGRLLKEFHGNVWCLRPDKWEEPVYRGDPLVTITSTVDAALADGGAALCREVDEGSEKERDTNDSVVAKLYLDSLRTGGVDLSRWSTPLNAPVIQATARKIEGIKTDLPSTIVELCPGLHPARLQTLFEVVRDHESLEQLIPMHPNASGQYERLQTTIRLLRLIFMDKDDRSHEFFAWLVNEWVHEAPLRQLFASSLSDDMDARKISSVIRGRLRTLEKEVRFRLVKFYGAYNAILAHVLAMRDRHDLAEKIEPMPLFLECGSANKTTLNLMSLGVTRPTAICASKLLGSASGANTPEDYLALLRKVGSSAFNMPQLCKRELDQLLMG